MTTTQTNPLAGVSITEAPAPTPISPASERQRNFLLSLMVSKTEDGSRTIAEALAADGKTPDDFVDTLPTRAIVSDTISRFLALPKLDGAGAVPEGFHLANGNVYKVQSNRAGTGSYAKVLVPGAEGEKGHFDYVGRAPFPILSADTILTAEKAAEFGHLYGICARCGATLTDEDSIQRGIGPVCAGKF